MTSATSPALSVVIPVYNAADTLPELLRRLTGVLDGVQRPYEIVLVDDGSADSSWEVIRGLAGRYPAMGAVRMMQNGGQHQATLHGLALARGEVVVTMDDDLQHPPDQVPCLLRALDEHPDTDAVLGWFPAKHHVWYRNLASALVGRLVARTFNLPPGFHSSGFRALRRPVVAALAACETRSPALGSLILQVTRRVTCIPVEHHDRFAGRSNYSLYRQFRMALDYLCNISVLPLQVVSGFGVLFCVFSVVYVGHILRSYLARRIDVPGWTSLIVMMSLSSGLILLALGMIGEYLVRILREVQRGPRQLERDRAGRLAGPSRD